MGPGLPTGLPGAGAPPLAGLGGYPGAQQPLTARGAVSASTLAQQLQPQLRNSSARAVTFQPAQAVAAPEQREVGKVRVRGRAETEPANMGFTAANTVLDSHQQAADLHKELAAFVNDAGLVATAQDRLRAFPDAQLPSYARPTLTSSGRVRQGRAASPPPIPGRTSPGVRLGARARSSSPGQGRMAANEVPIAERPWVPGGVLDGTGGHHQAAMAIVDRHAASKAPRAPDSAPSDRLADAREQACCEALYSDAQARRERQKAAMTAAERERLQQEQVERELSLLELSRSKKFHTLADTRTREQRDRELLQKREHWRNRAVTEQRRREYEEVLKCTFQPVLVAELNRRRGRGGGEEAGMPADGRTLVARQAKVLQALAELNEERYAAELPSHAAVTVQAQMQREETQRVTEFLRTEEGAAFLRARVGRGGTAAELAQRQAEIIDELVQKSSVEVERRVEALLASRSQQTHSRLQYKRLRLLHELDSLHAIALEQSGGETRALPEGFDAGAAARCRSAADRLDAEDGLESERASPGSSAPLSSPGQQRNPAMDPRYGWNVGGGSTYRASESSYSVQPSPRGVQPVRATVPAVPFAQAGYPRAQPSARGFAAAANYPSVGGFLSTPTGSTGFPTPTGGSAFRPL